MNKTVSVRRRSAAILSVGAMAITGLMTVAAPAGAVVTQGGGTRPDSVPAYFQDDTGLRVAPCENVAVCVDAFDATDGVYFDAGADTQSIRAVWSVGAGFDPAEGLEIDNSFRFSNTAPVPNGRYTIRDPWGTRTCNVAGGDMDCSNAVGTRPVSTFLRTLARPAGFLGNGEATRAVTGSPTGFNRLVIDGPGAFRESTSLFTVLGQMPANTPMADVNTTSLAMGNRNNARPVTRPIRYSSLGTANASPRVTLVGPNAARFTANTSACASVAPQNACNIAVTYRPQNNRNANARLRIATPGNPGATRVVTLQGTGQDTRRARVASSSPRRGQRVGVSKNVSARFNEDVRGVKKSSFQVVNQSTGNKVRGSVSRVGQTNRYVFNPRSNLDRGTAYRVRLVGGKAAIRDLAGNPLRTKTWKFRTR